MGAPKLASASHLKAAGLFASPSMLKGPITCSGGEWITHFRKYNLKVIFENFWKCCARFAKSSSNLYSSIFYALWFSEIFSARRVGRWNVAKFRQKFINIGKKNLAFKCWLWMQNLRNLNWLIFSEWPQLWRVFLLTFWDPSGSKDCISCTSRYIWVSLFPKRFYLGALRLFLRVQAAASASPLIFRRRLGYVRWISISRDPRGAQDFGWVALPCPLVPSFSSPHSAEIWFYLHRDGCAAAIRFYLHRDGCAAAIRVLSTQRLVRRGDLILIDLYLHRDGCAAQNWVLSTQRMLRRGDLRLR